MDKQQGQGEQKMTSAFKSIFFATTVLLSTVGTQSTAAALAFTKPTLTIAKLATRSSIAQNPSQDLLLRADGNGSIYLYVEQQQGALLAIFNVTNPEDMKLVASTSTKAHGAYNFVAPVKDGELVTFRDGSGTALLDLHRPKAPRFSVSAKPVAYAVCPTCSSPMSGNQRQDQGQSELQVDPSIQPRNVQFVSSGRHPRVLASLSNVTRLADRTETGTVFLLADGKVNVVRSHSAELQYEDQLIFPYDPN